MKTAILVTILFLPAVALAVQFSATLGLAVGTAVALVANGIALWIQRRRSRAGWAADGYLPIGEAPQKRIAGLDS